MIENKQEPFSITIDSISYEMSDLKKLGVSKLSDMKENYKASNKERKNSLIAPISLLALHLIGDYVAHNSIGPSDGWIGFSEGILAVTIEEIIRNSMTCSKKIKQLDQAVVMVSGDMDRAEFSSTKKQLVKKGYFQETRIGDQSTYQPVPV